MTNEAGLEFETEKLLPLREELEMLMGRIRNGQTLSDTGYRRMNSLIEIIKRNGGC